MTPKISLVVETWNLGTNVRDGLATLLDALAPQIAALDAEVVITHAGLSGDARAALAASAVWVELPADAGYYEHKNRGFAATTGDIVAFIDGDCAPCPTWLASITQPIAGGSRVVAGATSYAGDLAGLANRIDFPYFAGASRFGAGDARTAPLVRNFFANNVAFARDVFAAHPYPTVDEPMFHGQCQILALRLAEAGIAIRYAPEARVTHAWPASIREWLEVRLLRGADSVSLLPYVAGAYGLSLRGLGALPALAMLGARALLGTGEAIRRGPRLRGLSLVAGVTIADAIGAALSQRVYRALL